MDVNVYQHPNPKTFTEEALDALGPDYSADLMIKQIHQEKASAPPFVLWQKSEEEVYSFLLPYCTCGDPLHNADSFLLPADEWRDAVNKALHLDLLIEISVQGKGQGMTGQIDPHELNEDLKNPPHTREHILLPLDRFDVSFQCSETVVASHSSYHRSSSAGLFQNDETKNDEQEDLKLYAQVSSLDMYLAQEETASIDALGICLKKAYKEWIEHKRRFNPLKAFPDICLSAHKVVNLLNLGEVHNCPAHFLVRFSDVMAYWQATKLAEPKVVLQPPRKGRMRHPELCLSIPVAQFEIINNVRGHGYWKDWRRKPKRKVHISEERYPIRRKWTEPVFDESSPKVDQQEMAA